MENKKYYLDFVITGAERKELVQAISDYMEEDSKYLGAPSFAYQVGCFTIDRNGVVFFDSLDDIESFEDFLEALTHKGFVAQLSNLGCEDEEVPAGEPCGEPAPDSAAQEGNALVIQMPASSFTPEALNNLHSLVAAKGRLIRKARKSISKNWKQVGRI